MGLKDNAVVSFALDVQQRYGRDRAGYLAASVTYYAFLSLFPLVLLALSIVGFVLAGNPAAQRELVDAVAGALPGLEIALGENVEALVEARAASGAIGLAGLVWAGLGATQAAGFAVSRVFGVEPYGSFLKKKAWALSTTVLLGVLALVAFAMVAVVGNLPFGGLAGVLLRAGGVVLALALDFGLFLVAYRLLTQRQGPAFRELWPGALLAASGWAVLKVLGTWYVARTVTRSTAVYGTLAGAVGILLLLYLAARLLLYGAETNVVAMRRAGKDVGRTDRVLSVEGEDDMRRTADGQRSTPELMRAIAVDTAALVRKEVELAKQEITGGLRAKMVGAAVLATAAIFGLMALGFLGVTMGAALRIVLPAWLAWLLTAATFLVLAGGAAAAGVGRMKRGSVVPEETKRTVKEDAEWARAQLKR